MDERTELIRLDYEKAVAIWQQLVEIRFKLLAVVPVVTGAAVSFTESAKTPALGITLGLLGFLVTLGIISYDQRNTEIYEVLVRRAKLLELRLGVPPLLPDSPSGGPFSCRPGRGRKLFGITLWHDRGLITIYSATLGAWVYLFTATTLGQFAGPLQGFFGGAQRAPELVSAAIAAATMIIFWRELHRIDGDKSDLAKLLDAELQEQLKTSPAR